METRLKDLEAKNGELSDSQRASEDLLAEVRREAGDLRQKLVQQEEEHAASEERQHERNWNVDAGSPVLPSASTIPAKQQQQRSPRGKVGLTIRTDETEHEQLYGLEPDGTEATEMDTTLDAGAQQANEDEDGGIEVEGLGSRRGEANTEQQEEEQQEQEQQQEEEEDVEGGKSSAATPTTPTTSTAPPSVSPASSTPSHSSHGIAAQDVLHARTPPRRDLLAPLVATLPSHSHSRSHSRDS